MNNRDKGRTILDLFMTTQAQGSLGASTQVPLTKGVRIRGEIFLEEVGVASWVKVTHEADISLQHKYVL